MRGSGRLDGIALKFDILVFIGCVLIVIFPLKRGGEKQKNFKALAYNCHYNERLDISPKKQGFKYTDTDENVEILVLQKCP